MYDFAYHRPESLDAATAAIKGKEEDGRYLAGGMTLLPTLKMRLAQVSDLIDLSRVPELKGIAEDSDGVTIGAMTPHADVADSQKVREAIPALAGLAAHIGDAQVRNCGTIGGSIANNDPAADYPAALLALAAEVKTDRRAIEADAFFTAMFETALQPGELIVSVRFPKPRAACYVKFPNPASRYALVGVFVARTDHGVRVAVTGAAPKVFRHNAMEQALETEFLPESLDAVEIGPDGLNDDLHASAEYRAHLIKVMAKRAVAGC